MKRYWVPGLAALLCAMAVLAGCGHPQAQQTQNGGQDGAPDAGYNAGNGDVVQLNGFREIDIEWISGQVDVVLYDGEGIELSETLMDGSAVSLKMEWQVNEDESTLDIRSQPQLMSATEEKYLVVKLPRSLVLHGLDIETVSAGVLVDLTDEDTLTLQELDVTSVSGAISVYAANAGEISLSTTSGSVGGSVRTEKLEAENGSGSVVLRLRDRSSVPSPLLVTFRTVSGKLSGNVDFQTTERALWEFETGSGNVELLTVQ